MREVLLDYGQSKMRVEVPDSTIIVRYGETYTDPKALGEPVALTRQALDAPLGAPPLRDMAGPGKKAVIAFPDRVKGGAHATRASQGRGADGDRRSAGRRLPRGRHNAAVRSRPASSQHDGRVVGLSRGRTWFTAFGPTASSTTTPRGLTSRSWAPTPWATWCSRAGASWRPTYQFS